MANRRLTVLNPAGFQEVLQTTDTLLVDSPASFAGTTFSQNVSFTTASFSGNITVNGTPSASTDVTTVGHVDTLISGVTLTASTPINITSQNITIDSGTDSAAGAVRFATGTEITNRSAVNAAVKPDQLVDILDDLVITGTAPLIITESTANNYSVSASYATNAASGVIQFATDSIATTGTAENFAVNPKQLKDAIDAIPYATTVIDGLVQFANGTEITTGTSNTVAVTPAQLKQEVDSVSATATLPLTVTETNRNFAFDINYATTTTEGSIRLASSAEMTAGTSTTVAISPADLEGRLASFVVVDGTTTVKGKVRFATNSETEVGTQSDAAVTPEGLRYALDQAGYVLDGGSY